VLGVLGRVRVWRRRRSPCSGSGRRARGSRPRRRRSCARSRERVCLPSIASVRSPMPDSPRRTCDRTALLRARSRSAGHGVFDAPGADHGGGCVRSHAQSGESEGTHRQRNLHDHVDPGRPRECQYGGASGAARAGDRPSWSCCRVIVAPPSAVCSNFACIANFGNRPGYVMQRRDGLFSIAGGRSGSCSGHGNARALYAP
jgi:hypothetical protein